MPMQRFAAAPVTHFAAPKVEETPNAQTLFDTNQDTSLTFPNDVSNISKLNESHNQTIPSFYENQWPPTETNQEQQNVSTLEESKDYAADVGGETEFVDSPFNNQTNDSVQMQPAFAVVELPQASCLDSSGLNVLTDNQQSD